MEEKILTFREKLDLYYDLKEFLNKIQRDGIKADFSSQKNLTQRVDRWGKELQLRKYYYDV